MSEQNTENLREQAKQTIEDMPAETALGNRDPQGGGTGDPKAYDAEHGKDDEAGSTPSS